MQKARSKKIIIFNIAELEGLGRSKDASLWTEERSESSISDSSVTSFRASAKIFKGYKAY